MNSFVISIKLNDSPRYLLVKISGSWSIHTLKCLENVKEEADRHEVKNILFDLLGLNFPSDTVRFYTGAKVAEVYKPHYKVAVFMQVEKINKLAENVAVNRGANFKVLASEVDALDWLVK
jgi:hypothetical protein